LRYFTRASLVLAVGISIGVVVGWLVFSLSTLTGKPLFIVGGGLIGLVIAAIGLAYNRGSAFLTLSEMTINFPQLGEMKFAINSEYRRVAWKLFVETLTRISTQPLESEDGSLREALSSLYSLFNATRELLKNMPDSCELQSDLYESSRDSYKSEALFPGKGRFLPLSAGGLCAVSGVIVAAVGSVSV
jgi:hypothetical protein